MHNRNMIEERQGSIFILVMSIIAPLIVVILYFLNNACTYSPSDSIEKICQLYVYNDIANTLLTFSSKLSDIIMPMLFIPYLMIVIVFNILLIRPYINLAKYKHRYEYLPRNNRLFKLISGIYLGLGTIFSIISIAVTLVIIYMAIIFGAFWIRSSPTHPLDEQALLISNTTIVLGLCFFAFVPVLAILPYRSIYKEYNDYLNTYHPKDKQYLFRTGVLIAILLICLDAFSRQLG